MLESPNLDLDLGALSGATTPASFVLTIDPANQGDLADHVIVRDTDGDTLRIPISGRVVTTSYEVPAQVDLGTFCVEQATSPASVSLFATGTGAIHVDGVALAGSPSPFELAPIAPQGLPAELAAGASATVAVAPRRRVTAGAIADAIAWTTDVAGQPTATTMLSATFLDRGAAVSPPAIDFGEYPVHIYIPNGRRVTLQNCDPSPLVLAPPEIEPPFSIDSPSFPTRLAPGESATFSIGFHPARPGTFTSTLTISPTQMGAAPLVVALAGHTPPLADTDAGTDVPPPPKSGCGCDGAGSAGGAWPIVLALALVTRRRRRGASRARLRLSRRRRRGSS
jgi:hypothetical protein